MKKTLFLLAMLIALPIPHIYKIRLATTDSLVYFEKDRKTNIFRFAREE